MQENRPAAGALLQSPDPAGRVTVPPWSRFGMIPACDRRTVRRRQTDGRTESTIANAALCIASHADAV